MTEGYGSQESSGSDAVIESITRQPWYKRTWRKTESNGDPRSWPLKKKIIIVIIVSVAGCTSPLISTIYYPVLVQMQQDYQTSDTAMNASLAVYIFCIAFFPLIWASFSDKFGRRPVYLISFLVALAGNIGCGVSLNIAMFIAFRALSAIGSSSVLSMGAATIGDIFENHERGRAFSLYMAGPLLGPAIGPILGGYLNQGFGWQSIFWFVTAACFCLWLAILLFLPETRCYVQQKDQEKQQKTKWINPIAALNLLRYPHTALVTSFLGAVFLVYYIVNTNFTRIYTTQYHLDSGTVGLCYLPIAAGNVIGGILGGRASDMLYIRRVQRMKDPYEAYPEMRLGGVIMYVAILVQLLGFTAFGWAVQYNIQYAVGMIALFFVGLSLGGPNIIASTYLVDCFRNKSASVTACNNFVRYITAGVGSLVAADIQRVVMPGILYTVCGASLFLMAGTLVIVRRKGHEWSLNHGCDTSG